MVTGNGTSTGCGQAASGNAMAWHGSQARSAVKERDLLNYTSGKKMSTKKENNSQKTVENK